jgi:hypothetical protein
VNCSNRLFKHTPSVDKRVYFQLSQRVNFFQFEINDHLYNKCYYLADDIYLERPTFIKIIRESTKKKNKRFVKQQETCRKVVERAFSVLQSRMSYYLAPC